MAGRRIVICMDGTWNNAQKKATRRDGTGVLKPTNVLKLARSVVPIDATGTQQITLYFRGVGSMAEYPGLTNELLQTSDNLLGGATGAGFESGLEPPITFLANNHEPGDEVYIFGFSRGAAQARALTRFLQWMGGIPQKKDAYFVPLLFRDYLRSKGTADPRDTTTGRTKSRPDKLEKVTVRLLAVWDTVLAHGAPYLLSSVPAACVENARHAIAIDERRYIFKPEIWSAPAYPGQSLEQRWFAGVHSNVGGGYLNDGLANVSLAWFLREAAELGLATDKTFSKHYHPYPQDELYESKSWKYKIMDGIRRKDGTRSLLGHPHSANLSIDPSVMERIKSDPNEQDTGNPPGSKPPRPRYPDMGGKWYRPKNVKEYFDEHGGPGDLPAWWTQ